MDTNIKEQLISFDTAILAKEKKFDWKVRYSYGHTINPHIAYPNEDYAISCDFNSPNMGRNWKHLYSAPTQSFLQKWLREIHNIDVVISPERYSTGVNYLVQAQKWDLTADPEVNLNFVVKGSFWYNDNHEYPTYEQALEKGLQEALKLIEV